MFYKGESNVPGAPGNLLAGGPSFDINRGILPGSGPQLPLAYNPLPGTVPMGNAGFFAGPQMGQMPAGFQNKIVS